MTAVLVFETKGFDTPAREQWARDVLSAELPVICTELWYGGHRGPGYWAAEKAKGMSSPPWTMRYDLGGTVTLRKPTGEELCFCWDMGYDVSTKEKRDFSMLLDFASFHKDGVVLIVLAPQDETGDAELFSSEAKRLGLTVYERVCP